MAAATYRETAMLSRLPVPHIEAARQEETPSQLYPDLHSRADHLVLIGQHHRAQHSRLQSIILDTEPDE